MLHAAPVQPWTLHKDSSVRVNEKLGELVDLWLIIINQNGGFTQIWVTLKSTFFPVIIEESLSSLQASNLAGENVALLGDSLDRPQPSFGVFHPLI